MNRGPEEMADAPLGYQIWKLNNEMAAKMTAEKYALEIANKQKAALEKLDNKSEEWAWSTGKSAVSSQQPSSDTTDNNRYKNFFGILKRVFVWHLIIRTTTGIKTFSG